MQSTCYASKALLRVALFSFALEVTPMFKRSTCSCAKMKMINRKEATWCLKCVNFIATHIHVKGQTQVDKILIIWMICKKIPKSFHVIAVIATTVAVVDTCQFCLMSPISSERRTFGVGYDRIERVCNMWKWKRKRSEVQQHFNVCAVWSSAVSVWNCGHVMNTRLQWNSFMTLLRFCFDWAFANHSSIAND